MEKKKKKTHSGEREERTPLAKQTLKATTYIYPALYEDSDISQGAYEVIRMYILYDYIYTKQMLKTYNYNNQMTPTLSLMWNPFNERLIKNIFVIPSAIKLSIRAILLKNTKLVCSFLD